MYTRSNPFVCRAGNVWWSSGPNGGLVDVTISDPNGNEDFERFYSQCFQKEANGECSILVEYPGRGWVKATFTTQRVCRGPMPDTLILGGF